MDTPAIRKAFIDFFDARGHEYVPSASLVPNDPTLLFTNAGMNQFKPYFLGEQSPPYDRAVTIQKCLRAGGKHNDLDEVGKTTRHLTFFEMLGNFSFGDYYKEKACPWAWELVTETFGLDPDRLWVTVYTTDDEAFAIWRDGVGVPEDRIIRMGGKDNFWSMGVAGPCGPCSEVHIDRGPRFGDASEQGPAGNEERYVELWNLVFMENDCNAAIEPVGELPNKNIDTGAGLERIAMILQDADGIFDTDILGRLVRRAGELTGKAYGDDHRTDVALRILADHARGITFSIVDGVLPSNQERGYVLRALIRRAVRFARTLGRDEPVLEPLIDGVVESMQDAYPELAARRDFVVEVAEREEARFDETLRQGLSMLEGEITTARDLGAGIPGDVAFKLHDTFGFPIDLTTEIAREAGLEVDRGAFDELMAEQRERARAARGKPGAEPSGGVLGELADERGATEFLGYEHLTGTGKVIGISDGARPLTVASEGDEVDVVLDRTPFYAEGGGQVGDRGTIGAPSGAGQVVDTKRLVPVLIGHRVRVNSGEIAVGDEVDLRVDPEFRIGCERAHTATHILHWTLRDRLGEHATQAGSLVEPGRLRFDFHHFEAVGPDRVAEISDELQTRVLLDDPVRAYETSYDFARSIGAMAIFGEKYGDFVRVVEVGDYSKELCGGTHVPHTSNVGLVVVTSEGSVGANLRRIEALVGQEGLDFVDRRLRVLERAASLLKAAPEELDERIERLLATQREMEQRLAQVEKASAEEDAAALAGAAVDVDGVRMVAARRDLDVDALRSLAQSLKGRLGSAVVVLGTAGEGRANLVGAVSKDVAARGVTARDVLAPGAEVLGGGAGGKPELAVSGGPRAERIEEAIDASAAEARRLLMP
jgi:alanyl-tRNA synthetase